MFTLCIQRTIKGSLCTRKAVNNGFCKQHDRCCVVTKKGEKCTRNTSVAGMCNQHFNSLHEDAVESKRNEGRPSSSDSDDSVKKEKAQVSSESDDSVKKQASSSDDDTESKEDLMCIATTKKGTRCSRKAISDNNLCKQHKKMV